MFLQSADLAAKTRRVGSAVVPDKGWVIYGYQEPSSEEEEEEEDEDEDEGEALEEVEDEVGE